MKKINNKGLTLIEVIMTLTVLSIVICPLMNMFVLSIKINSMSDKEYYSIQNAQYYMEEIKSAGKVNLSTYVYNFENNCYEKNIADENNRAEIKVRCGNYGLYYVDISILKDEKLVNSLAGSIIFD